MRTFEKTSMTKSASAKAASSRAMTRSLRLSPPAPSTWPPGCSRNRKPKRASWKTPSHSSVAETETKATLSFDSRRTDAMV